MVATRTRIRSIEVVADRPRWPGGTFCTVPIAYGAGGHAAGSNAFWAASTADKTLTRINRRPSAPFRQDPGRTQYGRPRND